MPVFMQLVCPLFSITQSSLAVTVITPPDSMATSSDDFPSMVKPAVPPGRCMSSSAEPTDLNSAEATIVNDRPTNATAKVRRSQHGYFLFRIHISYQTKSGARLVPQYLHRVSSRLGNFPILQPPSISLF